MTGIEIDFIKNHLCSRDCIGFQYRECDECAVQEILDKLNKYKWHDLRKNPNDFPEGLCNDNKVLMLLVNGKYCTVLDDDSEIVAWKYIEPFENEEK